MASEMQTNVEIPMISSILVVVSRQLSVAVISGLATDHRLLTTDQIKS
jgi:hypothetical protein